MALPKATVKFTANFETDLASIEAFWSGLEALQAFMRLIEDLDQTVISNLERYPNLGRRFLNRSPQSLETGERISRLKHRLGDIDIREYLFGDYMILYGIDGNPDIAKNPVTVYLLAIRHHRQLSFDFESFWQANHG